MKNPKRSLQVGLNNKGSAIITVVVTMLFVMALGAALLFAAYTGYSITISQRHEDANFYDASAAMDDIRVGVQTSVTNAIAEAYTAALVEYTDAHSADYNPQTDFNDKFIAALSAAKVGNVNLFVAETENQKTVIVGYNTEALRALIDAEAQDYVTVSGGAAVTKTLSGTALKSISLKSITVDYIKKGYESTITTDIAISMPDFFAGSSITSSINDYALIANNKLIQSSGGSTVGVSGSVFAGSSDTADDVGINITNNGNKLTFSNGDIICKGSILVDNGAAMAFSAPTNELWAAEIELGTSGVAGSSGTAALDGKIYVADDLILQGRGSSATLVNTYFGFGNSVDTPDESSSILVNGRNSTLDISRLDKLSLAGIGFIDISGAAIRMGESMAVKSDQLAYLVPEKCISNYASNPCVFDVGATSAETTPIIDKSTVLWGTGASAKTLSYYIDGGKGSFQTIFKPLGSDMTIAYVFMVFSQKEYANDYFKAYFEADPSKIEQYLHLYETLSDKAVGAEFNAAGNTFYMDGKSTATTTDDKLTLVPANDRVYAEGMQTRYSKMQSPYLAFVNTVELAKLAASSLSTHTLTFTNSDNEPVAIVSTDANYTYDFSSADTVRLIISANNVTISDVFNGIVIAGNNITLTKNVTAQLLDSNIINATCTVDGTTYKLSSFIGSSALSGNSSVAEDAWSLDSLVFYENWMEQ